MKRIRVPGEMLKAAKSAHVGSVKSPYRQIDDKEFGDIVEAVLRYISEEAERLKQQDTTRNGESIYAYDRRSGYNAALDDIVKLFSEPEPKDNPVVKGVVDRFRGVTLSRSEADYIIDQINMVTHG